MHSLSNIYWLGVKELRSFLHDFVLLGLVGVVIGVGVTYLMRSILHIKAPTLAFAITPGWVASAVAIALCGAMFGALYPALKAARKDPIDALSYE